MQIQFNSDSRIEGGADTAEAVEARIRERLSRFEARLTRIEVHVGDVDGDRNGPRGVEAKIEARPAGDRPVVVTDRAADAKGAIAGALGKLVALLDTHFSKADAVR
ncbi:MAG: hypothetical protein CVT77_17260 [Alphaproteobacteria bacterium HGW-Alphaproteobacteria-16]|nr:MAG: hypothetical protein CVT77_17260 [Alphaproteobacteria bacterium HGW-Alphaproteobacteria-16]